MSTKKSAKNKLTFGTWWATYKFKTGIHIPECVAYDIWCAAQDNK